MLKPHLLVYTPFKKWQKANGTNVISAKKKQPSIMNYFDPSDSIVKEPFALAIYTSMASFSMFETIEWKAFHHKLGFKAPRQKALVGRLLTKCYDTIKAIVDSVADTISHIQIFTNGSSNITKTRVENTPFLVDGISYY